MTTLRVIDAGTVDAVTSQALWHGLATAMREGDRPTLSFCRPGSPYVGVGFHCSLDEIDGTACRRLDLPVIRRQLGGGPVLIGPEQLFFQITVPASMAPGRVDRLYERYLGPAVEAFRRLGVDARFRGLNDIAVGDRKISGTAAGRLGDAVVVVGNAIFGFSYETMARVLAFPSETLRAEYLRLLRAHLSTLGAEGADGVGGTEVSGVLAESYADHFGWKAVPDGESARERDEIARWRSRLLDPEWAEGAPGPQRGYRQIKVCSGVWLYAARAAGLEAEASIVSGRIEHLAIRGERLAGVAAAQVSRCVRSSDTRSIEGRLRRFGGLGSDLAELLRPAFELR